MPSKAQPEQALQPQRDITSENIKNPVENDEAPVKKHLETTARGVALAREALASARQRAIEAEQAHLANLAKENAILREQLHLAQVELHGLQVTESIEAIEAEESAIIAQAELNLEGLGLA